MAETLKRQNAKTILVVDDDEDFRLQVRFQLEADGYQVIEAESPAGAHRILESTTPDLMIVDLMMDEVDAGFTLCHDIKKTLPALPIILATAVASETGIEFDAATDEERCWVKADAVLNKPIRGEQLRRELNRLLR
ncbi:response regulator [bacterium]|nr:response regulator [bacterium]